MSICGICQKKSLNKFPQNIFIDKIGDPPVLLSEILMKISGDLDYKFTSNEICHRCTSKVCQYYDADQIMKTIQTEILNLLKAQIQTELNDKTQYNCRKLINTKNGLSGRPDNEKEIHKISNRDNVETSEHEEGTSLNKGDKKPKAKDQVEENSEIDCSQSVGVPTFRSTGIGRPTGIKCECCDRVFENHKTFQAHKKYYGFAGYVCELCGTTLFSQSGFVTHIKSHCNEKEFKCPDCGAQFHRKAKLTHHMAWHKGDKPFQCEICAKCFVHRVALTKHRHIHSDETRRSECQICAKKFRTLTHLTRHMAIHTGVKPFSCPICGKCFSQSYNMKSHLKQHETPKETEKKRFPCQKCLKSFTQSIKYDEHTKVCC